MSKVPTSSATKLLTLERSLIAGVLADIVLLVLGLVPLTGLASLGVGLEFVDGLARALFRLFGDPRVVDGRLKRQVNADGYMRRSYRTRTLWPPIWRVGRDMVRAGYA